MEAHAPPRLESLNRAISTRQRRRQLREALKYGEVLPRDAFIVEGELPVWLRTAKVATAFAWVPGIGDVRAAKLVRKLVPPLSAARLPILQLSDLTDDQLDRFVALCEQNYSTASVRQSRSWRDNGRVYEP